MHGGISGEGAAICGISASEAADEFCGTGIRGRELQELQRPYGMIAKMKKVFISNRGEIACRIAGTAHRMGIGTCGVYSPQDAHTRHVRVLQQVALLPGGDLSRNYLNAQLLVEKARAFGADCLHPGYGFLAENPEFAELVAGAGLIWVGPPPGAMRKLGGKIDAKEVAAAAGVPVAPWMRLSQDPDAAEIKSILTKIGLPALIKAAHGGGGRGQRIVQQPADFAEALRAARSEAKRSFGSTEVFIERFLDRPRHIEVQILADQHKHVYALGERDCTLQRRNQKVVEESPATVLNAEVRNQIHKAAVRLATAVDYVNAGTIEFLAQQKTNSEWEFYFMELNARLQVEHPVTEEIFGLDLVELQFRAAAGEDLSARLSSLAARSGHAMEIRLCAEDPANHFLPTPGPITEIRWPEAPGLRIETGFETGDVVPQEYDSLIAKIIAHGPSRNECARILRDSLENTIVAGIITNRSFLISALQHPDFLANRIFTRWIESTPSLAEPKNDRLDSDLEFWAKKFSSELFVQRKAFFELEPHSVIPEGPRLLRSFLPDPQIHGTYSAQGLVRIGGIFVTNENARTAASGWITRFEICLCFAPEIGGVGQRKIAFAGQFEIEDAQSHHLGPVVSRVPGLVLEIRSVPGQTVAAHQPVLVLEAMKIEMPVSLPVDGRITMIHVKQGDRIMPGQTLITWQPVSE